MAEITNGLILFINGNRGRQSVCIAMNHKSRENPGGNWSHHEYPVYVINKGIYKILLIFGLEPQLAGPQKNKTVSFCLIERTTL